MQKTNLRKLRKNKPKLKLQENSGFWGKNNKKYKNNLKNKMKILKEMKSNRDKKNNRKLKVLKMMSKIMICSESILLCLDNY